MLTGADLILTLQDPEVRQTIKSLLGLPSEAVAEALEKLTAAQARTDASLEQLSAETRKLAAAQAETEAAVKELVAVTRGLEQGQKELQTGQKELRQAVGALSDNVGFGLEELAGLVLPGVLAAEVGVTLQEPFARRFVKIGSDEEELDLFTMGERDGAVIAIVGEVKSRIYEADVRRFSVKASRVVAALGLDAALPVLFGFVIHPSARQAAAELGVQVVASRPG